MSTMQSFRYGLCRAADERLLWGSRTAALSDTMEGSNGPGADLGQ